MCLDLEAWPALDRKAWEVINQPVDDLDDPGPASDWAATTRQTNLECYGRWLAWLQEQQRLDHDLQPADRVTPANIVAYVDELRRLNASSTVTSRIRHLYCVLRAMAPDRDWDWLRNVESRLRKTASNARDKTPRVKSTSELFAYGVELMERADSPSGGTSFQRSQSFRDGLIIALLAARPLRRRNFAAIEIGRHLIRQGEDYSLKFSAKETKTRRAIAMPFPSVLVPFLERYLSQHRPLLNPAMRGGRWVAKNPQQRPQTAALWISTHGTPMAATTIYGRVIALTTAKFGHSVNPHLFRDSAATSVATEDPAHVHIVKDVLGHSTLKTSERYYMHAQATEAIPRHQNGILGLRRQSRDGRYAANRCRET
jgi:site-specific recombinase XerD